MKNGYLKNSFGGGGGGLNFQFAVFLFISNLCYFIQFFLSLFHSLSHSNVWHKNIHVIDWSLLLSLSRLDWLICPNETKIVLTLKNITLIAIIAHRAVRVIPDSFRFYNSAPIFFMKKYQTWCFRTALKLVFR